jgi:5-methylcytosine-specific restriction endonuclease McrA
MIDRKQYKKEYYESHKEQWNEYAKKRRAEKSDEINAYKRKWRHGKGKELNRLSKQRTDSKYHSKMKSDPEYLRKRRDAATEYNNRPEVKEHRRIINAKRRAAPEVKKNNAKYNKKHHEENREHYNKQVRKWNKANPEKRLIISKRHLEKLGLPFKLPSRQYGMALEAWGKSVRKLLGDKCIVCGSTDKLNSHHILYKALHPELSLNINNGVPLCKDHHLEVHRLNPI